MKNELIFSHFVSYIVVIYSRKDISFFTHFQIHIQAETMHFLIIHNEEFIYSRKDIS